MFTILILGLGITWFLGCLIYLIYFSNLFDPKEIKKKLDLLQSSIKDFNTQITKMISQPGKTAPIEGIKEDTQKLEETVNKLINTLKEAVKDIARNRRAFSEELVKLLSEILGKVQSENTKFAELILKIKDMAGTQQGIPEEMVRLIHDFNKNAENQIGAIINMIPKVGGGGLPKILKYAGIFVSLLFAVLGNLLYFKVI